MARRMKGLGHRAPVNRGTGKPNNPLFRLSEKWISIAQRGLLGNLSMYSLWKSALVGAALGELILVLQVLNAAVAANQFPYGGVEIFSLFIIRAFCGAVIVAALAAFTNARIRKTEARKSASSEK